MNNSPLKAIREKCMDCSGGSFKEVRLCVVTDCALWPFRHGQRPKTVLAKHGTLDGSWGQGHVDIESEPISGTRECD